MRYSLEQLQTLVLVAKTGSFSAAARQLGKTQSSVSMAIANLEIDLGLPLFDRSGKLPLPTEAGRKLLLEAQAVLERCYELEAQAHSLGGQIEASLTLVVELPYAALMAPLDEFAAQFPHVDLDLRQPRQGDIGGLLLAGQAQLGVCFAQPDYPRDLGFMQMGKLILSHVVGRAHPLAGMEQISFSELHRHRRLLFSAHGDKLASSEYLGASRCWRAEDYLALLELTRAGLGWTTLPRQLVARQLAEGELVELQLAAYPHTDWLVGVDLLWANTRALGKAGLWLRERLRRHKVFELDRNGNPTTL